MVVGGLLGEMILEVSSVCNNSIPQLILLGGNKGEDASKLILTPSCFLVEPENLVHHILKDIHTTKKKKTRVILRMLPISGTCKAFLEDMKKYTETFFEPWFKAPNRSTFQIVYKARNNSHMNREEVIKELAGTYRSHTELNPSMQAAHSCIHNIG